MSSDEMGRFDAFTQTIQDVKEITEVTNGEIRNWYVNSGQEVRNALAVYQN